MLATQKSPGVSTWSIHVAPSGLNVRSITRNFRCKHAKCVPTLRRVELDWPSSMPIIDRLAEYITDSLHLTDGGGLEMPLLHKAILAALDSYNQARLKPDRERFLAFVDGAVESISHDLDGVLLVSLSGRTWSPASGEALLHWLRNDCERSSLAAEQRDGPSSIEITSALREYILTPTDARIIEETRDERAK